MSYYIEVPEDKNKAVQLEKIYGAFRMSGPPKSISEIPKTFALVCVVENPDFDAAAYCHSDSELSRFTQPAPTLEDIEKQRRKVEAMGDRFFTLDTGKPRPMTWLLMEKELVERLTHFTE